MHRAVMLAGLALAACHSSPTVTATNASVEEVADKLAAARASGSFLSPGRWESRVSLDKIDLPGAPPEAAAKLREAMAGARNTAECLTKEEAARPQTGFFGGDSSCRYDHFTMAGGKLDAKMVCAAGSIRRTMTLTGTYGADAYRITVDSRGEGAGPAGMAMTMTVDGKRTGDCTGAEKS